MNRTEWVQNVHTNKGCTYNVVTGHTPTSGYGVALKGHTVRIAEGEYNEAVIEAYIESKQDVLTTVSVHYGAWVAEGDVWQDCTEVVTDRSAATAVALRRGELAIWDFEKGEEIPVKPLTA